MRLTAALTDSYQVKTKVNGHEYLIDQSEEKGGKGSGASPTSVMVAALAACKTMVAKGYLDAKKIAYDRVETAVDYEFHGPNSKATVEMTVHVDVTGANLNETQLKQLQLIVSTGCPVANVLDSEKNTIETIVQAK